MREIHAVAHCALLQFSHQPLLTSGAIKLFLLYPDHKKKPAFVIVSQSVVYDNNSSATVMTLDRLYAALGELHIQE